jgi:hypothetical protein
MENRKPFVGSAFVAHLQSVACKDEVEAELIQLLHLQHMEDPSLVAQLSQFPVTVFGLAHLRQCNAMLAPHIDRDVYGKAYAKFGTATAILKAVVSSQTLNPEALLPEGLGRIMHEGAEGLLELGFTQFARLAKLTREMADWIENQGFRSVALVESPIGNSLPVQVLQTLLEKRNVVVTPLVLTAPRNDKRARGRTVKDAASECAEDARECDGVVFLDDVLTGSRYIKIFEALKAKLDPSRFLAVGMAFEDPQRPEVPKHQNRERARRLLEDQGGLIGYPEAWVDFPLLPFITLDAGLRVIWQDPMIWGYFDVIAGKRKVNLIFTLIDHALAILKDLGQEESVFRPYLELAWSLDTGGKGSEFVPEVLKSTFRKIAEEIDLSEIEARLTSEASSKFPQDYKGEVSDSKQVSVPERVTWLTEALVEAAKSKIGEDRANMAANALFAVLSTSLMDEEPRVNRDSAAAQYVLPYHPLIQTLNRRILERVVEAAEKGWHYPALFNWQGLTAPS